MDAFPLLRTGAVVQYPLRQSVRFQTQPVRFLDGSQQRFRAIGVGLRSWNVKLGLLDERELNQLILFAEQQGGAAFAFPDPNTGDSVPNCIFSDQTFETSMNDEMNGAASLMIEELP